MSRVAKKTDEARLEELKKKVDNPKYVSIAVERISWELAGEVLCTDGTGHQAVTDEQ